MKNLSFLFALFCFANSPLAQAKEENLCAHAVGMDPVVQIVLKEATVMDPECTANFTVGKRDEALLWAGEIAYEKIQQRIAHIEEKLAGAKTLIQAHQIDRMQRNALIGEAAAEAELRIMQYGIPKEMKIEIQTAQ